LENINLPLRGFVRRFYVSNLEEFSFRRKRQYSYDERFTLKWRGNCERNFDGAFSSSFKTAFFLLYVDYVGVENSTWNIRWFYVEKWSSGGQVLFNVESTSIFILRLVRWIFLCRINRILRRKVSVRQYIFFNIKSTSMQRRIYVDSTSRFPHGSKRDIIGDLEVPVVSLFALLSPLKQWCKWINKGEWIYQVN